MITIQAKLTGHELSIISSPILSSDSSNIDQVHFQFDEYWSGFNKVALFWGSDSDTPYGIIVDDDDNAIIPSELISEKGTIRFGVFGETSDNLSPRITSTIVKYKVKEGSWADEFYGDDEATPSLVEQLRTLAYSISTQSQAFIYESTGKYEDFTAGVNTDINEFKDQYETDFDNYKSEIDDQIEDATEEVIPSLVSDWLNSHVNPQSEIVIDDSLSIDGAAADAKAVGDILSDVKGAFHYSDLSETRNINGTICENTNTPFEQGAFNSTNPDVTSLTNVRTVGYFYSGLYLVNPGQRLSWAMMEFTSDGTYVGYVTGNVPSRSSNFYKDEILKIPAPSTEGNKFRLRVTYDESPARNISVLDNTISLYSEIADIGEIKNSLANVNNKLLYIATEFSDLTSYAKGYPVYKDGVLYEFTSAHSGAWTGEDVTEIRIATKIYKSMSFRGVNVADSDTLLSDPVYCSLPGMYTWNTVHQPGDLPDGESGPGLLINLGNTNTSSIFTQLLVMNTSTKMYYRHLYSANTWTDWKCILTATNTPFYGYRRDYDDITESLIWERKSIGTSSGITDSTSRLIAKLPNAGNVEVKMNTPNSLFVIVQEDNTLETPVYTYLTDPIWSTYFYRYTGNPAYNYYVMTRMQNNADIDVEYGPLNVKVYIYDDVGERININHPWYGKKIAIIGDSIVQGRFRKNATSGTNSTAAKPAAVLIAEMCNTEPGNYGIGGATIYGSDWKSVQTNASKVTGYDIVLIFAGTNDFGGNIALADFASAYGDIIDTLKANNTTVFAITPTARSTNNNNSLGLKLKDYADAIKTISEAKNIDVIDLNTLTSDNVVWISNLSDGLHPNEVGQKILADLILQNNYIAENSIVEPIYSTVTSVAGKTGAVTLDAGDIEYDDTDTYAAGSVGAGLANLKSQMGAMGLSVVNGMMSVTFDE